jgi:hypothetical protein
MIPERSGFDEKKDALPAVDLRRGAAAGVVNGGLPV